MSVAIMDIQCVLELDNKYLIKEMSIVDTQTWATQHWIFKNSKCMQDERLISGWNAIIINYL